MKIRCIAKTGAVLPEKYLDPSLYRTKETEFKLIVGKEYVVYALYAWEGEIWYYICDERYTYYPIHNPAPLFKIVDPTPSQYWQTQIAPNGLLEMAFEHWFSIPYYYDKLTDQEEEAVAIFEKYKELMDAEAASTPPPSLSVEELLAISLPQSEKVAVKT